MIGPGVGSVLAPMRRAKVVIEAVSSNPPNTPTITAGTPGETSVTLTSSAYSHPDSVAHAASQWQVTTAADTGFSSPVIDTGDDGANLESFGATGLTAETDYICRVRYKDSNGLYSSYSATDSFTTAAANGGGGAGANEPVGYVAVGEHNFDTKEGGGWTLPGAGDNLTIQTDATAPISASNVGRCLFAQGEPTSGSLIPLSLGKSNWSSSDWYFRHAFKFSSNWQGHSSGVNKVHFFTDSSSGGGGDPLGSRVFGVDNGALNYQIFLQNPDVPSSPKIYKWDSGDNEVSPTQAQATVTRDQWHEVEIHVIGNTPGSVDGELHVWLDGVKILQFTTEEFLSSDSDGTFDNNRWEPVWGGSGDEVATDMYQYMDHWYLSVPS